MKTYDYEELKEFIRSELGRAFNKNLVYCYNAKHLDGHLHAFILLSEDICYEIPWHDGPKTLQSGDYLHANDCDIYGLKADVFKQCYSIAQLSMEIAP